jgi:gliding motility-associated protein GldL
MGLTEILQSKKGKGFMAYLYGWGSMIVIIGAMFKIQHWPFASVMLVGGLSIEAIIFFFSVFEPIHEEYKWELVYPELAHGHDGIDEHGAVSNHKPMKGAIGHGDAVSQELDKMLAEAKIGPELIESLGAGMKSLSEQAGKLTNMTDASLATNAYVDSVKKAASNVDGLSDAYSRASESLGVISTSNAQGTSFGEELTKASKTLAEINTVYQLQLEGSKNYTKATSTMYESINELMTNLSESVNDTKRYKTEVGALASNLEALNTVYGNMLTALNYTKK